MTTALTKFDELDFSTIKNNLKDFLSGRSEFQDHNFEGSTWSLMLDMMAYAVAYSGQHGNMALSETFLDSAQLRPQVVSRAKELNYFPRSAQASKAQITLSLIGAGHGSTGASTLSIPAGTRFAAASDNDSYQFVTADVAVLNRIGTEDNYVGTFFIHEGQMLTSEWEVPATGTISAKFAIEKEGVDTNHLVVDVRSSYGTSFTEVFRYAKGLFRIAEDEPVYFLQENREGFIEIFFGDGVIGRAVEPGNIVRANYLLTNAEDANGAGAFELIDDIVYYDQDGVPVTTYSRTSFDLSIDQRSVGGAAPESIESIRFSAPRSFEAQNRAVTEADYEQLLTENFGYIESVSVWGGEENDPPQFGRVFCAIKPDFGDFLSNEDKEIISDTVLNRYNIVGIVPELVDADVTYVTIRSDVVYDPKKSVVTPNTLIGSIETAIGTYFEENLSRFNKTFRFSRLVAVIDEVSDAILNNRTETSMEKRFTPLGMATRIYNYDYANAIEAGTFTSNTVTTDGNVEYRFYDKADGKVWQEQDGITATTPIGTIDYTTGKVELRDFAYPWPASENHEVRLSVASASQDINVLRANLLVLGDTDITLEKIE